MKIVLCCSILFGFFHFAGANNQFDNGYPESRYEFVLDRFFKHFSPIVEELGGVLEIQRDWTDGAVNAWGWREGQLYILEVPGGLSRYSLINEQAFVLVLCHELGHLLGGAPIKGAQISLEGQADYFSVQKCFRPFSQKIKPFLAQSISFDEQDKKEVDLLCSNYSSAYSCEDSMWGSLALTNYYSSLSGDLRPRLSTPDPSVVTKTLESHPGPQCRLDTFVASMKCLSDPLELPSWQDPDFGYCKHLDGLRPLCWYK